MAAQDCARRRGSDSAYGHSPGPAATSGAGHLGPGCEQRSARPVRLVGASPAYRLLSAAARGCCKPPGARPRPRANARRPGAAVRQSGSFTHPVQVFKTARESYPLSATHSAGSSGEGGAPTLVRLRRAASKVLVMCLPLRRSTLDRSALIFCEAQGPAERLALALCSAETGLGALDQQVPLELRDGVEDVHGQLAGRAGQINPAQ